VRTLTVLLISTIILLSSIGFTYYIASSDCDTQGCPYVSPTPAPVPTPTSNGDPDEDDGDTTVAYFLIG
jgi:hypothetical protein